MVSIYNQCNIHLVYIAVHKYDCGYLYQYAVGYCRLVSIPGCTISTMMTSSQWHCLPVSWSLVWVSVTSDHRIVMLTHPPGVCKQWKEKDWSTKESQGNHNNDVIAESPVLGGSPRKPPDSHYSLFWRPLPRMFCTVCVPYQIHCAVSYTSLDNMMMTTLPLEKGGEKTSERSMETRLEFDQS